MSSFGLLAVGIFMNIIAILFIICAVAIILIILIQKGKGGGLSAALGGSMASGILGSKTGDFLTWVTIILAGVFLMLAVVTAKFYKPGASSYGDNQPIQQQMPQSSEKSSPASGTGAATGQAATDANSLGS